MDEIGELVKKLYSEGFSAREVGEKIGRSVDAVYKLMRRRGISRRLAEETNKIVYLKKPASFNPVVIENQEQRILKALGVALYWAEGTKKGSTMDFANSDAKMIRIFLRFLREICRINERKIRIYLYCFPQHNIEELMNYWSFTTNVPHSQFLKPYIRRDAKGKTSRKMAYGLIHIRCHDKKLIVQLQQWIEELFEDLIGRGTKAAKWA